jgi:hypothetical protein
MMTKADIAVTTAAATLVRIALAFFREIIKYRPPLFLMFQK